jgi:hypothetical protein
MPKAPSRQHLVGPAIRVSGHLRCFDFRGRPHADILRDVELPFVFAIVSAPCVGLGVGAMLLKRWREAADSSSRVGAILFRS